MKKVLIGAGIAVVALILIVVIAVSVIDVNKYKPKIQAQLEKSLNRPVTLGTLSLKVIPLSVKIDSLSIGEAPELKSSRPFAQSKEVYVSVGLFSLLTGSPKVKAVRLDRSQVEVIKQTNKRWNFSSLGSKTDTASKPEQKNADGGGSEFTLDKLEITDGQVGYTDLTVNQQRSIYDHIDLTLSDYAPNKRFGVDLGIHLPGEGKQLAELKAKVGPIPEGNAAATPVDGHISLDQVSVIGVNKFIAGAIPENTDAVITGDADIKTKDQMLMCDGKLNLKNTKIRGTDIGYPIDVNYDLSDDRGKDVIQISKLDVKLGDTPISLSGQVNTAKQPQDLNLKLKTSNASITELARLAGAFGVAFNPKYKVSGNISADLSAVGSAKLPALSGTLNAKNVEISGGEIKQPVKTSEVALNLTPETVKANPFTLQSGSTQVTAAFNASKYTTPNMGIDASLKTSNADVGELLSMAKAYGVSAADGMSGSGKLSLDARAQGQLSKPDAMVYSGTASLANVALNTPTLTKPLLVKSANVQLQQNAASISNLVASIASTTLSGNMTAKNFAAPNLQFALAADNVNVSELQQISKKSTAAPSQPKTRTTGKPAPAEESLLAKMTGGGTLSAGTISAEGLVLNNVKATCKLDHGLVTLNPLTAGLFGGQQTGSLAVDTRPATPQVNLKTSLKGVDSNKLLSAVSSVKNTLFGSLAADGNIGFGLVPGGNIAQTLNGVLNFGVTNGELRNINILSALSTVGKFTGAGTSQNKNGTDLKKLGGRLDFKNGVASTDNLTAAIDTGSLSAKGIVNLVDQGLNMHMTAVLAQQTSAAVGGAKIGGFMNTALANNKGELVLPVLVSGNLQKPVFTPDVQAMAKLKLNNLLPTSGDPSKLTSGVLNGVLGGKGGVKGALGGLLGGGAAGKAQPENGQANQQQQQQQKPQDAVKGIFDSLRKKK